MVNSLDDCDVLKKTLNFTSVDEHNDSIVSIKMQKFRSRHTKFVYLLYFNCSRV